MHSTSCANRKRNGKYVSLCAIKKHTGKPVPPVIASKADEHICPGCEKEVILCKGKIVRPYFRHKVDTSRPCYHYNSPTESIYHKDAKDQLEQMLRHGYSIRVKYTCSSCQKIHNDVIGPMSNTANIEQEYRAEHDGPITIDVAYLENGELLCAFEIWHTHRTKKRPEPWFEFNAIELIESVNNTKTDIIELTCKRNRKCKKCVLADEREKELRLISEKKYKVATECLVQLLQNGIAVNRLCRDTYCELKKMYTIPKFNREEITLKHELLENGEQITIVKCMSGGDTVYTFELCDDSKSMPYNYDEYWFKIRAKHIRDTVAKRQQGNLVELYCEKSTRCDECIEADKIQKEMEEERLKEECTNLKVTNENTETEFIRAYKVYLEGLKRKEEESSKKNSQKLYLNNTERKENEL